MVLTDLGHLEVVGDSCGHLSLVKRVLRTNMRTSSRIKAGLNKYICLRQIEIFMGQRVAIDLFWLCLMQKVGQVGDVAAADLG